MSTQKKHIKKLLVWSSILGSVLGVAILFYFWVPRGPIYNFNAERDTQDILQTFDRDWEWLVASSRDEYSPEFILKYRTPNRNPIYLGRLRIKVMRQEGKYAGFVAYYMKTSDIGFILFLAVHPDFRNKGYGEQLARYALNDLVREGAKRVTLVTRTDNYPAQRVYNKLGFNEILRDEEGFVYFDYVP